MAAKKIQRTQTGQNPSPSRLLCKLRAQVREKLCLAEGFLQDGHGPYRRQRRKHGSGDHDNGDVLLAQPRD